MWNCGIYWGFCDLLAFPDYEVPGGSSGGALLGTCRRNRMSKGRGMRAKTGKSRKDMGVVAAGKPLPHLLATERFYNEAHRLGLAPAEILTLYVLAANATLAAIEPAQTSGGRRYQAGRRRPTI